MCHPIRVFNDEHLDEKFFSRLNLYRVIFRDNSNFVPIRGNFTRGIFASMYTKFHGTLEEAQDIFKKYYSEHPFTIVSTEPIDLKMVVNTNKCIIALEKHGDYLIIDNLLKGASGQAIQNMNLMFDLPETEGLMLKSAGF